MEKVFSKISPLLRMVVVILLPILIVTGIGWANLHFVRQNPGGNDFLIYYTGTRALLFEGQSPYSDTVAEEIQAASRSQLTQKGEHEMGFVYPLYSTLFFTPAAVISDFRLARAVWMSILEVVVLLTAYINLRLAEWDPPWGIKALYFIFALVWYHAVRAVLDGNVVILLSFLISLMLLSIKEGWDRWAGVLLAFSTIKPHLVIFIVVLVWIWALSAGRGRILKWFSGTLIVLIAGSLALLPDWILQNLWRVLNLLEYHPHLTLGGIIASWLPGIAVQLKWMITSVMGVILLVEWWSVRGKSVFHLSWTAALTLTASQWIGIPTHPDNFFIMYPALVLALAMWHKRWEIYGTAVAVLTLVMGSAGLWMVHVVTLQRTNLDFLSRVMFIPLPAFLLVALYWTRFWVVHPTRRIFE